MKPLKSTWDAEYGARKFLPRPLSVSLDGGSGAANARRRNTASWQDILLRPRVGGEPIASFDTTTSVMGIPLSMPVIIAPAGAQGMRPHAEVLAAKAAATADIATGVSNFGGEAYADVAPHNSKVIAQFYWAGTRDEIATRIEAIKKTSVAGLMLTMDYSFKPPIDGPSFVVPRKLDLPTMVRFGPSALAHPGWLFSYLGKGMLPRFEVPNFLGLDGKPKSFVEAMADWNATPSPTWDDVTWLKQIWGGPLMVKGILDPEDARRAVDAGVDAISVSNHGGNDVDDALAPVQALPAIVDAVGGRVDVTVDGGVRRGTDVIKAVALGAKAVLIGRPWLWAVSARGEQGVAEVLQAHRLGILAGLRALDVRSVKDLNPGHLIMGGQPATDRRMERTVR